MRMMGSKVSIATIILLLISSFLPAQAHSVLVSSNPAHGALLSQSPTNIVLNFSETLAQIKGKEINRVLLLDGTKKNIRLGNIIVNNSVIKVAITQRLAKGKYQIRFHVVADDGHITDNFISFSMK